MFTRFAVIIVALFIPAWTIATEVPDTQQSLCYSTTGIIPCPAPGQSFYGQDGNYHSTPRTFTKLDPNSNPLPDDALFWTMVLDNATGLTWEVKTTDGGMHDRENLYERCDTNPETNGGDIGTCNVEPDSFVSGDSEGFISALNDSSWGGHSDWHVPSIYELVTLVHWGQYIPAIQTDYFPNTLEFGPYYFMSSTYSTHGYFAPGAFKVDFSNGGFWIFNSADYVRAVHGTSITPPNMVDNHDTTVSDLSSELMWQRSLAPISYSWQNALEYCENLEQANYDDWRLPNIVELLSIADYSQPLKIIDISAFNGDEYLNDCWSSTTYAESPNKAWSVEFEIDGTPQTYYYKVQDRNSVRCVRGGTTTTPYDSYTLDLDVTGGGKVVITDLTTGAITGLCESSCNGYQYQEGTRLSLTAIADTEASFSMWGEDCTDSPNECLITMDANKVTSAKFLENGDLSGDGRRGLEEVIMILRELTGEN